jgi:hypothetical protein
MMSLYNRVFTIYERREKVSSRPTWEVWDGVDDGTVRGTRGKRVFAPTSRKKCYEFLNTIEGKRTYV